MVKQRSKTRTEQGAVARMASASARELQQKALSALASNPKPKNEKAASTAAVEALNRTHEHIFAIEEVGQWLPQVKEADGIAITYIVDSLCSNLHDCYCDAMDSIAHLKHPATPLLLKACESLDVLRLLMEMSKDDGNLPRKNLSALGRVILTFLAESVRWMEQASETLAGEKHGFGWLDCLRHVEGLPDGFKRLDVQQEWVVRYFGQLNDENRANVAGLIAELVKSQDQK